MAKVENCNVMGCNNLTHEEKPLGCRRRPLTMTKISISKSHDWNLGRFAKAPFELLYCDDLQSNSKLLWMILASQADYMPIDKGVLDKRIGIHRATRIRCMAELRELGFVVGTNEHIILKDPMPILRKLRVADIRSREIVDREMLSPDFYETTKKPAEPKVEEKTDYLEQARLAWNDYRPKNYARINKMSDHLMKSIDLHIKALKIEAHDYIHFFSVLKAGVEHSPFWSTENSSKTLQSIIGIGQPITKKYQNVHNLYNEGLNYETTQAIPEEERFDDMIIPSKLRKLIDTYDELHYLYFNMSRNDPGKLETLSPRILETEENLREAGLEPASFRMKYQLTSWPSDVPEPETSRERFWRYDDEL